MTKIISNKRARTLNAKSNQIGLTTFETLQVILKLMDDDRYFKWKNKL